MRKSDPKPTAEPIFTVYATATAQGISVTARLKPLHAASGLCGFTGMRGGWMARGLIAAGRRLWSPDWRLDRPTGPAVESKGLNCELVWKVAAWRLGGGASPLPDDPKSPLGTPEGGGVQLP